MKKIYLLLFALLLNFNSFSQDDLLGEWHLYSVTVDGINYDVPEIPVDDYTSHYPSFNFTQDCDITQCFLVEGSGTYSSLGGYYSTSNNILTFENLYQSLGGCESTSNDVCNYEGIYFNVIHDGPHNYNIMVTSNSSTLTLTNQSGNLAVYGRQALSYEEFKAIDNLSIYPNPTKNLLNVELGNYFNEVTYTVYNSTGKVISGNLILKDNKINVDFLESGLYFLKIEVENQRKYLKFIKQ